MLWNRAYVVVGLAMGVVFAGCASDHPGGTADAGPLPYDGAPTVDAAGDPCGPVTCGAGLVCCNASCGICAAPGTTCIALACEDAGPVQRSCGGLGGLSCNADEYCDYPDGSFCGGDDSLGVCRPRPTACPDPGGVPVCGCDGNDYLADCSAYMAGTDIAHFGSCAPTPTPRGVSASRSCGPADGPAWDFVITDGAPVCNTLPGGASLSLNVWDGLEGVAAGTVFTIGETTLSQGMATYCPAGGGGPPCLTLTGTVTFDAFVGSETASFSYDLSAFDGSRYTGSHVSVGAWCPGAPLCG